MQGIPNSSSHFMCSSLAGWATICCSLSLEEEPPSTARSQKAPFMASFHTKKDFCSYCTCWFQQNLLSGKKFSLVYCCSFSIPFFKEGNEVKVENTCFPQRFWSGSDNSSKMPVSKNIEFYFKGGVGLLWGAKGVSQELLSIHRHFCEVFNNVLVMCIYNFIC